MLTLDAALAELAEHTRNGPTTVNALAELANSGSGLASCRVERGATARHARSLGKTQDLTPGPP